ncbi:MAG: hypothetical protein ABIN58_05785 [candidate division WOR-3 bacterium]
MDSYPGRAVFFRQEFGHGVMEPALTGAADASVLYYPPWPYPSTPYWKPMPAFYASIFVAVAWAAGGIEVFKFDRWNSLWLLSALSPFGFLSNRRWAESDAQPGAAPAGDSASLPRPPMTLQYAAHHVI